MAAGFATPSKAGFGPLIIPGVRRGLLATCRAGWGHRLGRPYRTERNSLTVDSCITASSLPWVMTSATAKTITRSLVTTTSMKHYFRLRGREYAYHIGRDRLHGFYGRSVVRNEFHRDAQGRFVNEGIGKDRVAKLTRCKTPNSKREMRLETAISWLRNAKKTASARAGADKTASARAGDKTAAASGAHTEGASDAASKARTASSVSKVYRPPASASRSVASQQDPRARRGFVRGPVENRARSSKFVNQEKIKSGANGKLTTHKSKKAKNDNCNSDSEQSEHH